MYVSVSVSLCVCVCFMCVCLSACPCVCVFQHLRQSLMSFSLFLSFFMLLFSPFLPLSLSLSLYQSLFSSLHLLLHLLLPRAAWCSRVWFPVVGSAVPPLANVLKVFPLLISGPDDRPQRRNLFPWRREALIRLVAGTLACPNLLADLIDGAQVRVIHQLHEVTVPQLLIGRRGPASAAWVHSARRVRGQVGDGGRRGGDYFQGDAQ